MIITNISSDFEPVLLMSPPEFYAIPEPDLTNGHANDFAIEGYKEYAKNQKEFRNRAMVQWKNLKGIFNALGVKIVELDPVENNPDLVFTADPSLSFQPHKGSLMTMFSRFSNEERQIEVGAHADFFQRNMPNRPLLTSHYRTEGTGDNVYDPFRDIFWSGYTHSTGRMNAASGRSDQMAHQALKQITGVEVVSLAVERPFFHIDTALAPLPGGHMVCFKDGMKPMAYEKMLENAFDRFGLDRSEYLIEVSKEDAAKYACNLRCIGNTVILSDSSVELRERISSKGYTVIPVNMSQFIHSGGSIHCVTNNINEARILGGYAQQMGFKDHYALRAA